MSLYCPEVFSCFCEKCERNFKPEKTVKKHTNHDHGCLNFMKTLPNMIICLGKASKKKEKKLVEFSTKVGGWGQQWTDFPLFFFIFFNELKPLKIA